MNERIRAIIADDEPLARELLVAMLAAHPDIEIVRECSDGRAVLDSIREERPDLVLLDIQMPGLSGLEVAGALRKERAPAIVFVTAFDRYAINAFEIHAADYLLKPFDEVRLASALDRVRERKALPSSQLMQLLEELRNRPRYRDRLLIRADGRSTFVPTAQIDWLQAEGKYTKVHAGSRSFLVKQGISVVEEQMDPERFVRVNRSAIVQIGRVQEVHRWFKGEHLLVLSDGTRLTTGRNYRERVEEVLGIPPIRGKQ